MGFEQTDAMEALQVSQASENDRFDGAFRTQLFEGFNNIQASRTAHYDSAQRYLPSVTIRDSASTAGSQSELPRPNDSGELTLPRKTGADATRGSAEGAGEGSGGGSGGGSGETSGLGLGEGVVDSPESKAQDRAIKAAFENIANRPATKSYNSVAEAVADANAQNNQAQNQALQIKPLRHDRGSIHIEKTLGKPRPRSR